MISCRFWPTGKRMRAFSVHLLVSLLVGIAVAWIVLGLWYPYPFSIFAGGWDLLGLLFGVDVVLGPILTLIVYSELKTRKTLIRDLATVALIQLGALTYGLWSAYLARPMYLVHEVDRIVVISVADLDFSDLKDTLPIYQKSAWQGIQLIGLRKPINGEEFLDSVQVALAGKDVALRPDWWQPLSEDNKAEMRKHSKSLELLFARSMDGGLEINHQLRQKELEEDQVVGLPLITRNEVWTVLLNKRNMNIVGYVPIDSF